MSKWGSAIKNVLTTRPLFKDTDADVLHARCVAPCSGPAEEEHVVRTQMIVTRRGVFDWQQDGRRTIVDGNIALVVSAGSRYRVAHPTDGGDESIAINADIDAPSGAFRIEPWFRLAVERLRRSEDALEADERVVQLFAFARGAKRLGVVRPAHRDVLEAVRASLALRFAESLRLDAIARTVNLSPYHLARRFRAYTGSSLHQYRIDLRLAAAHARLADSDEEVGRIGVDVGFASASHFSAAYARRYGVQPAKLRARV
jgi:AraC-like DNA-binding protein